MWKFRFRRQLKLFCLHEIRDFGRIPIGPAAKFVSKVGLVRGLAADVLESIREKEKQMEAVHSEEVQPDGLTGTLAPSF